MYVSRNLFILSELSVFTFAALAVCVSWNGIYNDSYERLSSSLTITLAKFVILHDRFGPQATNRSKELDLQ